MSLDAPLNGAVDWTPKGPTAAMTPAEHDRRAVLVATISRHLDGFMEAGAALVEMRDSRLYRSTHPTFAAYCADELGLSRSSASQTSVSGSSSAVMAEAIADAAKAGPRTADMSRRFLEIVLDAEQAQRPWAVDELAAIQNAGAGARFKRAWRPEPKPVPIRASVEVDIQQVIGVRRDGDWQQLPLGEVTGEEISVTLRARIALRDRATDELVVLRRLKAFYAKRGADLGDPLADVVATAGVSLDDVLAGAA